MIRIEEWSDLFPEIGKLDVTLKSKLAEGAVLLEISPGQTIFSVGDGCQNYLLVVSGVVKVQMTSESGREIVLYRVGSGESCILTTSSILANEEYMAEGVTESDVRAIAIPVSLFQDLIDRSQDFRDFVFRSYGSRITGLVALVEEVAFGHLDVRLARLLVEQANNGVLEKTHQEIATELGTAREVVSRQLKAFETKGWLHLSRGQVQLRDDSALRTLGDH